MNRAMTIQKRTQLAIVLAIVLIGGQTLTAQTLSGQAFTGQPNKHTSPKRKRVDDTQQYSANHSLALRARISGEKSELNATQEQPQKTQTVQTPATESQEPSSPAPTTTSDQHVILVVGAKGSDEYSEAFSSWAENWKTAAAHTKLTVIGVDPSDKTDKEVLSETLTSVANDGSIHEVWLVLLGHGTFDGKRAKYNLRGPDIEATELAEWVNPIKQRLVVVNCTSCSSPFINALTGKNRIIVTATKNGFQYSFARFGKYLAEAINDSAIDLDKDGQTSMLEAFCAASQSVEDFYLQENRIATENALLDDNGDGLGTPSDWFEGVRATRQPKKGIADGIKANQVILRRSEAEAALSPELREKRDALESQLEKARVRKSKMDETQYLAKIEPILIELAMIYAEQKDQPQSENANQ